MNEENNDVMSESSPEPQEQSTQTDSSSQEQSEPIVEQAKPETAEPFHLHPRFQELVSQRNEEREARRELQRQMQDMSDQMRALQKSEQPKSPAIKDRLKGIDPEFADYVSRVEKVDTIEKELQELRNFRNQIEARTAQQQTETFITKFYSDNKVPDERQELYQALLMKTANENKNLRDSDLPDVMKSIHEKLNKTFQSLERQTTQKYVENKSQSAAKPTSQPKGQPVKSGKMEYSKNPGEARQQLVQQILQQTKASKEI